MKETLNKCEDMVKTGPNELVRCVQAKTMSELQEFINEFIKSEECGYVRSILPITWTGKICHDVIGSIPESHFGALIRYEPRRKESVYVAPDCEICKISEDHRRGLFRNDKFYCYECLDDKLQQ